MNKFTKEDVAEFATTVYVSAPWERIAIRIDDRTVEGDTVDVFVNLETKDSKDIWHYIKNVAQAQDLDSEQECIDSIMFEINMEAKEELEQIKPRIVVLEEAIFKYKIIERFNLDPTR